MTFSSLWCTRLPFWCLIFFRLYPPFLMPDNTDSTLDPDLVWWCAQTPRLSTLMPLHDPPWHNSFDFDFSNYIPFYTYTYNNFYFYDYCNNTQKHGHNLPDWRDLTTKHSCPSGLRGPSQERLSRDAWVRIPPDAFCFFPTAAPSIDDTHRRAVDETRRLDTQEEKGM